MAIFASSLLISIFKLAFLKRATKSTTRLLPFQVSRCCGCKADVFSLVPPTATGAWQAHVSSVIQSIMKRFIQVELRVTKSVFHAFFIFRAVFQLVLRPLSSGVGGREAPGLSHDTYR